MLVGALVPPFEDPEEAEEVVDADDDVGVAYTLVAAEPSLPPVPYVADADSENDDHPVDDGYVDAELPGLDVEIELSGLDVEAALLELSVEARLPELNVEAELPRLDVELESRLVDALLLVESELVPEDGSVVPSGDNDDVWNSVALATHVSVVTVLLGRVYVVDTKDEGRKEVYDVVVELETELREGKLERDEEVDERKDVREVTSPEVSAGFEVGLELGLEIGAELEVEIEAEEASVGMVSVEEAVSAVVDTGSTEDMVVSVAEEAVVEASAPLEVRDIAL